MKPAPFDYYAPNTLDEALALLAEHGYDAKVLAGGQSLVPTMNFRLAQPTILIDLNRISELAYIDAPGPDGIRLGAMTRQRAVERSELCARHAPLLHAAMPHIAHVQIRNRGTVGGSLAHADPAAELPAVAVAAGARLRLQSSRGERWIDASDFYTGLFSTALAPDELLVDLEFPAPSPRSGWSIHEVSRREGDYALVGVATEVALDESGACQEVRMVFLSVGEGPVEAVQAAEVLRGQHPTEGVIAAAADAAAHADIEPTDDIHASAAYRRHLARVLAQRSLREAFARAEHR